MYVANLKRGGARGSALSMATCSVVSEQSSFLATPFSPLCKPTSSVRRCLTSRFTSTDEPPLSEPLKSVLPVCDKSSLVNVWRSLGVDQFELSLALTLPTGQSFRWKLTGDAEYTGVVDKYLFTLRQTPTDVEYMLHNSCICSTGCAIEGCRDTDGPHFSTDGMHGNIPFLKKISSSETHNHMASSVNAAHTTIASLCGESVHSGNINACHSKQDGSIIVNATEITGVSQKRQVQPAGSDSAEMAQTGVAVYLCQTHGPRSCCLCLDCAEASLKDYFNLGKSLKEVWAPFVAADKRFAALAPYMRGARLLRQCPLECVFQFICSSNNHIRRISQMVDYLAGLGPHLGTVSGHTFHAFPSLDKLSKVTEAELRKAGFGYRSKYIVGAVKELQVKKGGGKEWLKSLRASTMDDALTELCSLPGIGPKVAACVALFSLDQHSAIPVDTHVWQIATRYIAPELSGERLSAKMHASVSEAFVKRFGEYAGWAQNVLFIAELSSHQSYLPEHLRASRGAKLKSKGRKKQKLLES